MQNILIRNAKIVNEGVIKEADIFISDGIFSQIGTVSQTALLKNHIEIDAKEKYVIPGIIDDQVHFREPGLTHKACIASEARAAVAGGITTFMEMPNTSPPATTQKLLEEKYEIARNTSLANYSFFMGTTNLNSEEVLKTNPKNVCGVKIFMGSSTGDMLVENPQTLERIFCNSPTLIAIHSENDSVVRANLEKAKIKYGAHIPAEAHPEIRDVQACYQMTEYAVGIARKCNTKLHVLHISTEEELAFFSNNIPLKQKKITAEVCVHHLYFDAADYKNLGNLIKWNPAIKEARHKKALFEALLDDRLDIIATDHAPHTWEEKQQEFLKAPSGGPLVQHALNIMLDFYDQGRISLEKIVDKMCHKPAELFEIERRGFIKEGYWADLALLDLNDQWKVEKSNILYHCGWSALEGKSFIGKVTETIVSGHLAYQNGQFIDSKMGERVLFDR